MKPHRRLEITREPLRERLGSHPAIANPALQLKLAGELIRWRLSGDRADSRAGAIYMVAEKVNGTMRGVRVIIHAKQYAP